METKKILKSSKIVLIVALIFLAISIGVFVYSNHLEEKSTEVKAEDYNELISDGKDEEGHYVEVNIVNFSGSFAEETNDSYTRKYYFVVDKDDYWYVARLTDDTYNKLEKEYESNPDTFSYELKGYIYNLPHELKDLAIETYNEGMETDLINEQNYSSYFGKTYLDEKIKPSTETSSLMVGIGVFFAIFAIIMFIIYIANEVKYRKTFKKYNKEELEAELQNSDVLEYKKAKIYLTNSYVISNFSGLQVIPYQDIVWLYDEKRRYNGVSIGIYLIGVTVNKKRYQLGYTRKDEELLIGIMQKIKEKNPEVMIGYTKENIDKYKEIKKGKLI